MAAKAQGEEEFHLLEPITFSILRWRDTGARLSMDFDCLTVTLGRLAMLAAGELPMGIDYALALISALTVPGETAASCEAPSEPVQEREGKAPVQAARVPETPDVTVATSMEAPAAGALAVPSCRSPRR